MSDTPQIYSCGRSLKAMVLFSAKLERELNAANVEIEEKRKDVVWLATEKAKLEECIKRLEDSYAAKDAQLSNLLHICRDNDIEVSSYDLIHGKEAKR